jgi:hypothetical protein
MGFYHSTPPTYSVNGTPADFQFDSRGNLKVAMFTPDSAGAPSTGSFADGVSNAGTGLYVDARNSLFNGTSWDRETKANQTHRLLSAAASTNATSVKASAGNVHKVFGTSANAAARYLKFYNKASAPTVGSDTPVLTFYIPPNTVNGGVFSFDLDRQYFSTGIAYAMTTAAADADTGALTAGDVIAFNITYS